MPPAHFRPSLNGPPYASPNDDLLPVLKIKRAALRAARAWHSGNDPEKETVWTARLEAELSALPMQDLNGWAVVLMIDNRWCGATGQGGIWAVASRFCNEAARRELGRRPPFEIVN